jgi:hypothetical protein
MWTEEATAEEFSWLQERTGFVPSPACVALKAIDARGIIRGMVAFDCWTHNAAQLHFAVDAPIAFRTLIPEGFRYVFEQADKGVISAAIAANNKRSIKMAERLGLRQCGRIEEGHAPGIDLLILQLKKENCRWIQPARRAA